MNKYPTVKPYGKYRKKRGIYEAVLAAAGVRWTAAAIRHLRRRTDGLYGFPEALSELTEIPSGEEDIFTSIPHHFHVNSPSFYHEDILIGTPFGISPFPRKPR